MSPETDRTKRYWAGHILQFGIRPAPTYDSSKGTKLLVLFIVLEILVGPRLTLTEWMGMPVLDPTIRTPLLFLLALVLIRKFADIQFSWIGLYSWTNWSPTERWYFLETFLLANGIFAVLFFPKLEPVLTTQALWITSAGILVIQMLWGFYQELIYRGVLQTELVRRWGPWTGILVSNTLFTFGPLHFYHFRAVAETPSRAWIFAAIFAIGLFFSVLRHRSGNLWMVGIFHGIGDWYITGLQQVVSAN